MANAIQRFRKRRGWTQAQLADELGTSQSIVSRDERRPKEKLDVETAKKYARVFHVSVQAILGLPAAR